MTKLLPDGTPTGLCDCKGREIKVGDLLRIPVECNEEMHGKWSLYRVVVQGITPLISYVRSEKGALLPEGYMAAPLADEYDRRMFVFARDSLTLRPEKEICVVDPESMRPGVGDPETDLPKNGGVVDILGGLSALGAWLGGGV